MTHGILTGRLEIGFWRVHGEFFPKKTPLFLCGEKREPALPKCDKIPDDLRRMIRFPGQWYGAGRTEKRNGGAHRPEAPNAVNEAVVIIKIKNGLPWFKKKAKYIQYMAGRVFPLIMDSD